MATPVVQFNPATGRFDAGASPAPAPAVPKQAPPVQTPQPQGQYTYEQIGARIRQSNPEGFSAFTDAQIGERAVQRKPELQAAVSGSASAPPPSFNAPPAVPNEQSGGVGGFFKDMAKGIARPFATLGVTAAAVPHSLAKLAMGDVAGAQKITDEGYNLPFLGQIKPAKIGADIGEKNVLGMNKDTLRTLGTGAELAANISPVGVGGQASKTFAQQGFKQGLKTLAKPLLKEGAAIGGSQALGSSLQDENVTPVSAVANTAFGTAAGAGFGLAGQIAAQGLKKTVAPAVRSLMPFLTNIPKVDINWAVVNEKAVMPKIQVIKNAFEAGQPELAEATFRKELLDLAEKTAGSAKAKVGAAFQDGVEKMKQKFPQAQGDLGKIWQYVLSKKPAVGSPFGAEQADALNAVIGIVKAQRDMGIDGMAQLKRNLWNDVIERVPENSPAGRMALGVYKEVDKELNRVTNGGMKKYNDMWSAFMDDWKQIRPIVSDKPTEDTARQFVASLLNASKGGAREALERMGSIAGIGVDTINNELRASRIARALMQEAGKPGSRVRDILVSGAISTTGGLIGSPLGIPGAIGGAAIATGLGSKITSPQFLSKFIFEGGEDALQKAVQKAVGTPAVKALQKLRGATQNVLPEVKLPMPKKVNVKPKLDVAPEMKSPLPVTALKSALKKEQNLKISDLIGAEGQTVSELGLEIPVGEKSMTNKPIDVIKTGDGYVILDGQHRAFEAMRKGAKLIRANIMGEEEALKKYGEMWPQLSTMLEADKSPLPKAVAAKSSTEKLAALGASKKAASPSPKASVNLVAKNRLQYKTGEPIKSTPLFRAIPNSRGKVEEVMKKFSNPIVFEEDQIPLIEKLIKEGVPGAREAKAAGAGTYPKTRDEFLDKYYHSQGYDAIVYKKTSNPFKVGVEIRDTATGKSYAVNPETARLYSL